MEYYTGTGARFRLPPFGEEEGLKEMNESLKIIESDIVDQLYVFFINPLQQAFEDIIPSYYEGKNVLNWEGKKIDVKSSSTYFFWEIFIADGDLEQRKTLENEQRWRKVDVFPTELTWDSLERWKEIHLINSDIPYPKTLIQEENWLKVAEFFVEKQSEMNDIDHGITEYIYSGSISGRALEDIANGIKK